MEEDIAQLIANSERGRQAGHRQQRGSRRHRTVAQGRQFGRQQGRQHPGGQGLFTLGAVLASLMWFSVLGYGAAAAGDAGVAKAYEVLETELVRTLGQIGRPRFSDADAGVLATTVLSG